MQRTQACERVELLTFILEAVQAATYVEYLSSSLFLFLCPILFLCPFPFPFYPHFLLPSLHLNGYFRCVSSSSSWVRQIALLLKRLLYQEFLDPHEYSAL